MEQNIYLCLERIKLYKDKGDIKYIQTEIGKYRLEALKFCGYIIYLIIKDANEIERVLRKSIEEYNYQKSSGQIFRYDS